MGRINAGIKDNDFMAQSAEVSETAVKNISAGPRPQLKILGILGLLIVACLVTAILSKSFTTPYNI